MKLWHRYQTFCLLLFVILPGLLLGQNRQLLPDNIQLQFLKDSLEVEPNGFSFNSCSVVFSGSGEVHAEVSVLVPEDVNVISPQKNSLYTLSTNQQQMIPLRFMVAASNQSAWQPVTVLLRIRETGQELSGSFYMKQKATLKWKAGLEEPEIIRSQVEEEADVFFWVENAGNVADEYKVMVDSKLPLSRSTEKTMTLLPGEKKQASFRVSLRNMKANHENSAKINIRIRSKTGDEKIYVQQLTVVGSRYTEDFTAWKQMPLSLELSAMQSPQTQPLYSAALRGQMELSGQSRLLVDGRWYNFTNPQRNARLGTVQYQNNSLNILAGSIIDFHHFLINGTGLAATKKTKGGELQLAAIRGNLYNTMQYKGEWQEKINGRLSLHSDNFSNLDYDRRIYSTLSVNNLEWKLDEKTSFSLTAGGGFEQVRTWKDPKDLVGGVFGYRFETEWKHFQLRSRMDQYSKSFPGFNKGYTFHDHELKKKIGNTSISGYFLSNKKIYTDNQDSLFTNLFNINNTEYGIRTGWNGKGFSVSLSGGKSLQQQDSANSPVVESWRTAANVLWNLAPQTTLSLSSQMSMMHIQNQPATKSFPAFNNYGSFQFKRLGVYFQYNSGPFYYFETRQYLQNKEDYRRVQLAPYFEQQFSSLNTSLRLQLMYNEELPNNFRSLAINNQLLISPPALKADIGINSSYNLEQVNASYLMVTFRKSLNLPVYKNSKSQSFTAILFRDVDGNNRFDEGVDAVIPHVSLLVDQQLVQTNTAGEIQFKNVNKGPFHLDLSRVRVDGWMPTQGYMQTLSPLQKEKRIYIPFKQSRMIHGVINLVTDAFSNTSFTTANIRVTATDGDGHSYNTLTDEKGRFQFNLPAGQYIITLNREVFGQEFVPEETTKTADLEHNEKIELQFQVRQQKRKINIRKID